MVEKHGMKVGIIVPLGVVALLAAVPMVAPRRGAEEAVPGWVAVIDAAVRETEALLSGQPMARPVLIGPAEPGPSAESYRLAMDAALTVEPGRRWPLWLSEDTVAERAQQAERLDSAEVAFRYLRDGARRTEWGRLDQGFSSEGLIELLELASFVCERRARAGATEEALTLFGDALQLAGDLWRGAPSSHELYGYTMVQKLIARWLGQGSGGWLETLDRDQLQRMAALLESWEAGLPRVAYGLSLDALASWQALRMRTAPGPWPSTTDAESKADVPSANAADPAHTAARPSADEMDGQSSRSPTTPWIDATVRHDAFKIAEGLAISETLQALMDRPEPPWERGFQRPLVEAAWPGGSPVPGASAVSRGDGKDAPALQKDVAAEHPRSLDADGAVDVLAPCALVDQATTLWQSHDEARAAIRLARIAIALRLGEAARPLLGREQDWVRIQTTAEGGYRLSARAGLDQPIIVSPLLDAPTRTPR